MPQGQPLILHFTDGEEPSHRIDGHIIRYIMVDVLSEWFYFSYPGYAQITPTERFYVHHHSRALPFNTLRETITTAGDRLVDAYAERIRQFFGHGTGPASWPPFTVDLGPRPPDPQSPFRKPVAWAEGSYDEPIGSSPVLDSTFPPNSTYVQPQYALDGYMVYRIYMALDRRFLSFVVRMLMPQGENMFIPYPEERVQIEGRPFWDFMSHACMGAPLIEETLAATAECFRQIHGVSRMNRGWPQSKSLMLRDSGSDHGLPKWVQTGPTVDKRQKPPNVEGRL